MAELGLVVNARNAMPDRSELHSLGLTNGYLRTIVYQWDDLDAALGKIEPSTKLCCLLNNETGGVGSDYSNWEAIVSKFAVKYRGRVAAVEIGNELDLLGVPVETAARLVIQASPLLRQAGMKVILSSVAGGNWVEYMRQLANLTRGYADFSCGHFYGQRAAGFPGNGKNFNEGGWGFGELADAIQTANDVSGLPVALTELGIKVGDAGGEGGQAEYVRRVGQLVNALPAGRCPFACYFAWTDRIGGPDERGPAAFGLRREDGSSRPAWQEFALAHNAAGPAPTPLPTPPPTPAPTPVPPQPAQPRLVLGFGEWAAIEPDRIGLPLEDEHGFALGVSLQRTTNGTLYWIDARERIFGRYGAQDDLSEVYGFDHVDGSRYRWRKGWVTSQRVGA